VLRSEVVERGTALAFALPTVFEFNPNSSRWSSDWNKIAANWSLTLQMLALAPRRASATTLTHPTLITAPPPAHPAGVHAALNDSAVLPLKRPWNCKHTPREAHSLPAMPFFTALRTPQECMLQGEQMDQTRVQNEARVLRIVKVLRILKIIRILKAFKVVE
jgi:hypothetical protein